MKSGGDVKTAVPPAATDEPEPNTTKEMTISSAGQDPPVAASKKESQNREEDEDEDAKSRTVRVGNVVGQCTAVEVLMHFRYCGTVDKVTMKKGYAYVEFVEAAAARRALLLDQSVLHGRRLSVTARDVTAESRGAHRNPVPPRGPVPVLVAVEVYSPYNKEWATAFVPQYFYPSSEEFPGENKFGGVHNRQPEPALEFSLSGDCIGEAERLQREAEKKRIKEEIISAGLAWRRALEAEALGELQMENFDFPGSEPLVPSVPPLDIDHHPQAQQQQTLILENPNRHHCGVKRKVESLSVVPSLPCQSAKKPNKEWSCALCCVSSDCEKDLICHFQGSKHKAKEGTLITELEALKAEVAAKGCNIPLVANNSPNLSKLSSTAAGSELNAESKDTTLAAILSDFCADAKIKIKEQVIPVHKAEEVSLLAEILVKGCSTPLLTNSAVASSELKLESKVTTPAVTPSDLCADAQIKVKEKVIPVHKAKEAALKAELEADGCSTQLMANIPSKLSSTAAGSELNAANKVTTTISANDLSAGAKRKVKKKIILVRKAKEAAPKAKPVAKGCNTPLLTNKPSNLSKLSSAAAASEPNAEGEVTTPAVFPSNFCADAKINVKEQVIPVHRAKEAAPKAELAADGCSTPIMANILYNTSKLGSTAAGSKLNAESKVTTMIGASDFGAGAKTKVKKKTILVRKVKKAALKAKPAAKDCSTTLLANKPSNMSMLSSATAGSELNAEGEVATPAIIPSDCVAYAKIKVNMHAIPVHKAIEAAPKAELAADGCSTPLAANIPSNMSKLSSTAAGSKLNAESKISTPEMIASDITAYAKMKVGAQAKPVPGHCGVKRKAESLSKVPSRPCLGVKKPKEERSCALCHVRSNSEKAWNDHLQGRKHKANTLKAEVPAKVCGTILSASIPANQSKLSSAAASSKLTAEAKMKVGAQMILVDKAKDEALKAELTTKSCSTTVVANSSANLIKFSSTTGSKLNSYSNKVTTPAIRTSNSGAYVKMKVEAQGFSKHKAKEAALKAELAAKDSGSTLAANNTASLAKLATPMLGLSADGKKGDVIAIGKAHGSMVQEIKTEEEQYVPENGIENAALKAIITEVVAQPEHSKVVHEADAKIVHLLSGSPGKKDDIPILKADGSIVLNVKAEVVHDVPGKEKVERAASDATTAEVVAKAEHSKVFREADAKTILLVSGSVGKKDSVSIVKADDSIVHDPKTEGVQDVPGKEKVEIAASDATTAEVVANAEHPKAGWEADGKIVRLVSEAHAELLQLLSRSIGKQDHIATRKADGPMFQDVKAEAAEDVPENERAESAAANPIAAEDVAKIGHSEVVEEASEV